MSHFFAEWMSAELESTESLKLAALAVLGLVLGGCALVPFPTLVARASGSTGVIGLDASAATPNLTYAYPYQNQSTLASSGDLSATVLRDLGLSGLPELPFNGVADPNDLQNQTYLPDGSYVDGPVVRFAGNSSWLTLRYSLAGHFLGLTAVAPSLPSSGPTGMEKLDSARAIAQSLGIPIGGDSVWTESNESVFAVSPPLGWRNETTVRADTFVGDAKLVPANSIVARFEDYSPYAVLRLDISAWFSANWSTMLPIETLNLTARQFVEAYGQARGWTIKSTTEIGLVPFPDFYTFGDLYFVYVANGTGSAGVRVFVDGWSGRVLSYSVKDLGPTSELPPPSGLMEQLSLLAVAMAVIGAGIVAFTLVFRRDEPARYRTILTLVQLARFVGKTEIDNFVRGQVLGCIAGTPGITYSQLSKILSIANGTLTYHISVLEKEGFIRSRRIGAHKCHYPTGTEQPVLELAILSPLQLRIVETVRREPGISPGAIARTLSIHRRNSSYNVKRLADLGFLSVTKVGRRKSCIVAPNLQAL